MQYTENYSMNKPQFGENAIVTKLNENADTLDTLIYNTRQMQADSYDSTQTYNTGDLVSYNSALYRCLADNVTGTWDATKWAATNLAEEVMNAGGGESALADLEDVEITNPSTGQALLFDDDDDKWKNQDLPDVSVTKTATGNPIEFTDGADAPLVKCTTAIQGNQDLHGYDKPWVGGAGVNKMPPGEAKSTSSYGVTITSDGNGIYTFVGTCTEDFEVTFDCDEFTILSVDNSAFYLFNTQSSANTVFVFYNGSTVVDTWSLTPINRVSTYTEMKGSLCNKYGIKLKRDVTYNLTIKPMLAVGTSYTAWTPYSNICPITAYNQSTISVGGNEYNGADNLTVFNSGTSIVVQANNKRLVSKGVPVNNNDLVFIKFDNTQFKLASMFYYDNPTITVGVIANNQTITLENTTGEYKFTATNGGYVYFYFVPNEDRNVSPSELSDTIICVMNTTHTATFANSIYQGNADFVGGSESHDMQMLDWTGLSWTIVQAIPMIYAKITGAKTYGSSEKAGAICSHYETITRQQIGYAAPYRSGIAFDGDYLCISDPSKSWASVSDALADLTSCQIAYELATPTTETITPTNLPIKSLFGYNHIESSTGDMEIEYITQGYQPLVDLIQSSNGHTYSTQEQVVGKWIDGSTMYEKSFKADNISDDSNHVLDAALTQSAIILLPGTEIIISCTGTYNTDFINTVSDNTFGRVIANVNGLCASIVGYSSLSSQLGTCTLYVTARYIKKSVSRSLSKSAEPEEPTVDKVDELNEEPVVEEEKAVNEEENTNER